MTALEIIRALKSDRKNAVLWINNEREEAAFHSGQFHGCVTVDYNAAIIAKGDANIGVVDKTDGLTYAAI